MKISKIHIWSTFRQHLLPTVTPPKDCAFWIAFFEAGSVLICPCKYDLKKSLPTSPTYQTNIYVLDPLPVYFLTKNMFNIRPSYASIVSPMIRDLALTEPAFSGCTTFKIKDRCMGPPVFKARFKFFSTFVKRKNFRFRCGQLSP